MALNFPIEENPTWRIHGFDEYQKQTGDEIGQIISEDVYSDEDIEEIKASSKIPLKEI